MRRARFAERAFANFICRSEPCLEDEWAPEIQAKGSDDMACANGPSRSERAPRLRSKRLLYAIRCGKARLLRVFHTRRLASIGTERTAVSGGRKYDPELFAAIVLYVAWEARDDARFGRTKLAKVLFYADFDVYADTGQSVTGAKYEHWPRGPFPPALYEVERSLEERGYATIKRPEFKGDEAKLHPTRKPPNPPVEAWILELYRKKIRDLADDPSWQVSDKSHTHPGWELTEDRDEIPYHSHFISRRRPPEIAFEIGKRLAREHRGEKEWT